jgi:type 1 glutamine amidotransferase
MIGLGWRSKDFGPSITIDKDEKIVEIPAGQGLPPGHPKEQDFQLHILTPDHPITRGMPRVWLHPHEQLTHGQHGPAKNMTILTCAWATDVNENEPMDWVIPYGKGRVYVTMLGHLWKNGPDTAIRCAGFQTLLMRGLEWAATGEVTIPIPADFPGTDQIRLRDPEN